MQYVVAIQSGKLNVRSGPGTQHSVVGTLANGMVVDSTETRGGWHRLLRAGGWSSGQFLQPHGGGSTTNGSHRVATSGGKLNMRAAASGTSSVIGTFRNGSVVQVVQSQAEWRKVSQGGWVHAQFLVPHKTAGTRLPAFDLLWTNYPAETPDEVKSAIGGRVDAKWIENTCTVRLSRALNLSGAPVPGNFAGMKVVEGGDGRNYAIRVREMRLYLESHYGPPTVIASGDNARAAVSGRRGIILFDVQGWSNATGHVDVWNGSRVRYSEFFSESREVLLWER